MRRILTWGFIALAVWWVIKDPASAAHAVSRLGGFASHAAASFTAFLSGI